MIFLKSRNLQHQNLLRDKLRAKMVIRARALFNLQRNNVARQVVRKCCPYYLTFMLTCYKFPPFVQKMVKQENSTYTIYRSASLEGVKLIQPFNYGRISSVSRALDCRAGGCGFDSQGWTITQGLKITDK